MTSSMRGLNTFISDIRNCRSREEEEKRVNKELANIRSNFKEGNMNGYSKKKYVCKLMYIYLLGWNVDFGHMEAVNLLSASKYSEKQIGYLAVTLLIAENSELAHLIVNSMRKDLEDNNEIFNCLALQAISDIGSKELAESLIGDIFKRLTSPNSQNFVKKKAALCLLRLYRKFPEVVPVVDWAEKLMETLEDYDHGVNLACYSLLSTLAVAHPDLFEATQAKAINKLHRVGVDREFIPDNLYYFVPVPWLQVKLMRHILLYPPPKDLMLLEKMNEYLNKVFYLAQEPQETTQQAYVMSAIIAECLHLATHINPESEQVAAASQMLIGYVSSKDSNMRYLGLEMMARFAAVPACLKIIKENQATVAFMLQDKDTSVRKRAIDVLFCTTDGSNAKEIVESLMSNLSSADYDVREELVLKIAILTEKYTQDPNWYVDMIFKLLELAGEQVSNEVWQRVVHVITNNTNLHLYAAKQIFNLVKNPTCPENAVKIAGYLLGEFGDLIVDVPGCGPMQQFTLLRNKYKVSTPSTRALLLSTFAKFTNLFPELKGEVLALMKQQESVLDAEIQQRACEYTLLISMPTEEMLNTVFEPMPEFPAHRESALVSRLKKQAKEGDEGRASPDTARRRNTEHQQSTEGALKSPTSLVSPSPLSSIASPIPQSLPSSVAPSPKKNDLLDLLELDAPPPAAPSAAAPALIPVAEDKINTWFRNLLVQPNGVLYEDATIQIGVKSEYRGAQGRVALYLGNKTSNLLSPFSMGIRSVEGLSIIPVSPVSELAPLSQASCVLNVECQAAFASFPLMAITYGMSSALPLLKLPIGYNKFSEPFTVSNEDFMVKWKAIGGPPKEVQQVFKCGSKLSVDAIRTALMGLQWTVLTGIDPNPNNFVCASVWLTQSGTKYGSLMRMETNADSGMYRITIRSTNPASAEGLKTMLVEYFSKCL